MAPSKQKHFDVIILGGGAAGLMCALTAGQRGRSVLVLESSNKLGKKILMSGGGRCNFTNLDIQAENYLSTNPHFFKSALKQYTQWDFINLVAKHDVDYHEKKHGQLFCTQSAKDILNMLHKECLQASVEFILSCQVDKVSKPSASNAAYAIASNQGHFSADKLVVATGGLSIPSLGGATGLGYQLAGQFGLPLTPKLAALVPMTLSGKWHEIAAELSGVAVPVSVTSNKTVFTEDMLFTHRGLSGPAILQLSNYWRLGQAISIDLLPNIDVLARLLAAKSKSPKSLLRTQLNRLLPSSLITVLEREWWSHKAEKALHEYKQSELEQIAKQLHHWLIKPSGTEGYRTAEVTLGGINTDYLSSKTMEVNTQAGLYFIGEVVDVTGHLGGYNFQWAWSSGYVAGQHV